MPECDGYQVATQINAT
jgi:CheY-like chemotaxis protein